MEIISQLQEQLQIAERRATGVKPPKPEFFEGKRTQLRSFLTQMDMQLRIINCDGETNKIIYVSTYLRGQAFNWFEPYIREFNEKPTDDWGDTTKKIFVSYTVFKKKLEQTFGDIDAQRTAERRFERIRQTSSASIYAAEFQQIISYLDYDNDTYIWLFERGLKEDVKDELMRIDRPTELAKMIEVAVKFDNRLYERKLQQRKVRQKPDQGSSNRFRRREGRRGNQRQPRKTNDDPYRPQPMELDTARLPTEEEKRRKKKRLCYNCGKPGHIARDCRSKKNDQKPQQLRATQERGAYDITGTPTVQRLYATRDEQKGTNTTRGTTLQEGETNWTVGDGHLSKEDSKPVRPIILGRQSQQERKGTATSQSDEWDPT